MLAVASAVGYSIYILINARVAREGMGIQSSAFIMLGAAAVYGLLNVVFGFTPPTGPKGYVAVALIALVSTVVAFWSFLTGMQKTGPSTAALVSTLEPVVVVVCSVLILSEKLTVNVIIGGCLVLAALVATALPGKKNGE